MPRSLSRPANHNPNSPHIASTFRFIASSITIGVHSRCVSPVHFAARPETGLAKSRQSFVGWVERSDTHRHHARMTNYRRSNIAGARYFFTVNLADRSQALLTENITLLRSAFEYTRECHPFIVDAIAVLPEHMHAIWTLPDGDSDFALRWRLIKTVFSRGLPQGEHRSGSRQRKGERGI